MAPFAKRHTHDREKFQYKRFEAVRRFSYNIYWYKKYHYHNSQGVEYEP